MCIAILREIMYKYIVAISYSKIWMAVSGTKKNEKEN